MLPKRSEPRHGGRGRRPLVVGVAPAIFQQVTGINTVIYVAPTIFQGARGRSLEQIEAAVGGGEMPGARRLSATGAR